MDGQNDAIFVLTPRKLERIAYIFIILALVALLIFFAFIKDPTCETPTNTTVSGTTTGGTGGSAGGTGAVNTTVKNTTAPVPNCTDAKKNQDETDVDCGGAKCLLCEQGKKCLANADCATGRCTGGFCVAPLSGDVTFALKGVDYTGGITNSAKVTGLEVSVVNGKSTDFDARLEVYVKTANGNYYLNQPVDDEKGDPYLTVNLTTIKSGATLSPQQYDVKGAYLYSLTDIYAAGDDFLVVVDLVDADSGEVLKTAQKKIEV